MTIDDCLAHATLADHHPKYASVMWVMLDDEVQEFAHQLLEQGGEIESGRQFLQENPSYFEQWVDFNQTALKKASAIADGILGELGLKTQV